MSMIHPSFWTHAGVWPPASTPDRWFQIPRPRPRRTAAHLWGRSRAAPRGRPASWITGVGKRRWIAGRAFFNVDRELGAGREPDHVAEPPRGRRHDHHRRSPTTTRGAQ